MPSSILNSDDGVISGTSGLKNSGGDDAVLLIQTNGTTAQTVDSGQRTKFPTTIGVGGATPSASGSGISFPATQSASSDANTLDDYEEGTFTPTIIGASTAGTGTYSAQVGRYTKIGHRVFLDISLEWSAHTGTGSMRVSGLPFTPSTSSGYKVVGPIVTNNITLTANTLPTALTGFFITQILLIEFDVGGGGTSEPAIDSAGDIQISINYQIN
jgi:hypothetical protein